MSTTYEIQVVTHSVHVRSTPQYIASGSNVVGYIFNGNKFTATKYQNGWYYIPSKKGWSRASSGNSTYIKLIKTNTVPVPTPTVKKEEEVKKEQNPTPPPPAPPKTVVQVAAGPSAEYKFLTQMLNQENKIDTSGSLDNNLITFSKQTERGVGVDSSQGLIFRDPVTGAGYSSADSYARGIAGSIGLTTTRDFAAKPANYSDIEGSLAAIRRNMNIFEIGDRDKLFSEFNRYKIAMPDYHATKLVPYIFFTKPELGMVNPSGKLITELQGDPLWESLYRDEPKLFSGLDADASSKHSFNAFLSNTAMSFQASDEVLKTVDHGETYTGWKMVYGRNTNESNTAGQFSISYIDDHNFNIYKMHKIWVEYINRVYRGEMAVRRDYIFKKVLTYPCSLYYIVCAADGETVLYWTKYFGVFPINTPSSVSSWTHGSHHGIPEFSVNYMYAIKEDFHPISLNEFNRQSSGSLLYRNIYDPSIQTNSRSLAGAPFIDAVTGNGGKLTYKLRFRES